MSLVTPAGKLEIPVLYQVKQIRTGMSFSLCSVKAVQHDKPIFICHASFQKVQPSPIQYQLSMPTVPSPEELLKYYTLINQYLK